MAIDISTLQVNVKSDGITKTGNALDKLTISADKAEQAVKKLGTHTVGASMAGSAGATVALTNALLLLNTTVNKLTTGQQQNTITQRANTEAMRDAHAAARGLAGSLGVLWMTYGSALPLMAGAAIGASFKAIATQGAELEHTLTSISVKGEVSVESMKNVKAAVMDLGQGIYGPQQVANALETMVMAGMKAEAAVVALGPALNLATVGGTTIEKSAYTLVQVGTAMGYTADSFGIVADVIAKTAATSMSSVESLSEAFKSASSVGVVYGVTLKDLGVSLALLSNLGIQGSAAGTANKNFYKELDSEAKKVTGTLSKLGIVVDRDLKIDGKFKDIGSIVKQLSDALDKAGDKGGKAMQAITNERGMRQMAALLQAYRSDVDGLSNAFQTAATDINNSAGFVALGAAQIALSTKNQMTSTLNTLKTSFAEAFEAMAPQMNVVARELKNIFKSEEFKSGLAQIAAGMATFISTLVKAAPLLFDIAKGFLAIKAAMFAHAVIMAMAGAMTTLSVSMAAVGTSALTLSAVLPPLIAAIAVATAAWAAYSYWKNNSLDTAKTQAQVATNAELLDSLTQEGDRLSKVNDHLAKGTDLTRAQAQATRDLAMAKMKERNADSEAAAKSQFMDAFKNVSNDNQYKAKIAQLSAANDKTRGKDKDGNFTDNGRGLTQDSGVGRAILAYSNWNKTVQESAKSVAAVNYQLERVNGLSEENVFITELGQAKALRQQQLRAKIAAADAGNPDVSGKPEDSKAKAAATALANEAAELKRLTAGYEARTEAIEKMTDTGVRAISRVQEARVLAGKYADNSHMVALAREADVAKFEQQKAAAVGENSNKTMEIVNRDIARRAAEKIAGYEQMGMLEKVTAAILLQNSVTGKLAQTQMEQARTADEVLRIEAALTKLRTATGSSEQRAQGLIDEADAMNEYGRAAKQTALQFAEAEVAKLKLAGTGNDAAINQRLQAAGLEDVAKAYNNLSKLTLDYSKRVEADNAIGVAGVLGAESAKVEAHRKATQDIIDSNLARAVSGIAAAEASGDAEKKANAKATYDKAVAEGKKASDMLKKYFTIDIKVAGLKDVSGMFSSMGKAANAMGESFAHVGTALDGLASSFATLSDVQSKQGISEEERLQGQIGAYGNMASASASFFQEGSKGYKTMMGVSKVFHAAEMAMGMVRMGKLAVEAVLGQAKGDPYTAWGRMAAMAAVVAGLGFAVGGGFKNGGGGGKTAAEMQAEQGTGSVFGDAKAKSESITKAMEALKANSDESLPLTQSMLKSLQGIEAAMGGLTNLVLRTTGTTDGANMGIATGTLNTGIQGVVGGFLQSAAGMVFSPILSLIAKFWGSTSQKIVDAGLQIGGSVSGLQNGQGVSQYASVDTTKSSWFGLSKKTSNSVQTQGVSAELAQQFGLIFTGLEATLKTAATALGQSSDDVGTAISNMVISTTSISLKGLAGKELQDALNGVISKTMDEIAEKAFPSMGAFRQVGEGYAQTVVRVATSVEQAQVAMKSLGITAVAYTDIVNKQGDVAFQMAQQSIALKEAGSGVGLIVENITGTVTELVTAYKGLIAIRSAMADMNLGTGLSADTVTAAGGTKNLADAMKVYYEKFFNAQERAAIETKNLTKQFEAVGHTLPTSRDQLRTWIEAAAKIGDQKQIGGLLSLAGAFDSLLTSLEKTEEAAEAAEKIDLVKVALDNLDTAFERLTKSVDAQKEVVEAAYNTAKGVAKSTHELNLKAIQDNAKALKLSVGNATEGVKATISGITTILNTLKTAVQATEPVLSLAAAHAKALGTAKTALAAVKSGAGIGGIAGLEDALKELAKPSEAMYSSLLDYQLGQAEANYVLKGLEEAGNSQLTEAQQQLKSLESIDTSLQAQIDAENERYDKEQAAMEAKYKADIDALDKTLAAAQAQLDALKGIDSKLLSMTAALMNFASAATAAAGAVANQAGEAKGGGGVADAVESLYKSVLGRESDAAGKSFWMNVVSGGASLENVAKEMMNSAEYKGKYPSLDVGTNNVPHDMLANIHEGERIIPAADNAELMRRLKGDDGQSNEALVAKMDELIRVIMAGDVANVQKTNELYKLIRDWNGVGMPPVRPEA